jgi:hypothetical protein
MLFFRAILSGAIVIVGAVVVVRMAAYGFRGETVPGVVLGAAMIALGLHRLRLIARAWRFSDAKR